MKDTKIKVEPKKERPQELQQEAIVTETKELKISAQETFYGEVINDIPNGQGSYSFSNGNSYEGSWLNGKFNGKGTYFFTNGDSFTGEWQNNLRNGVGTYKWKDQSSLKALWENNQTEGRAFFLVPNQPKRQLYFSQGRVTKLTNRTFDFKSADVSNSKFRLTQKQQRIYNFSKKLNLALSTLHINDPKLLKPDLPPHIFIHKRYFAGLMSERDMQKAEFEMKQDFFSVKRYILTANKSISPEEENGSIVGDLDGYSIPTAKLGVVLDTSGSMLKYIKPLKEQITQTFPSAAFIEVESCRLTTFNTGKISE